MATGTKTIGLIAGNGKLPFLFADAARANGFAVHAVAHRKETDPALIDHVDSLTWVSIGQLSSIVKAFRSNEVKTAVMAGGISRFRILSRARPDFSALAIAARLVSKRDDETLRAIASFFEQHGVQIVSPTELLPSVLAPVGHLAGPVLSAQQKKDLELAVRVAETLGRADVGQTVVVKDGVVLAVEAVEGTDETIRRAARYGGKGVVIAKRSKPQQDVRFDLPSIGPTTVEVMREVGASVLAVESGRSVVIESALVFRWAAQLSISIVGY